MSRRRPRFSPVLFDLDGTLLETRRDIATAANLVLAEMGLPQLPPEEVSGYVGRGARVLMSRCIERASGAAPSDSGVESAFSAFRRHYALHMCDTTLPYPGIFGLLDRLKEAGVPMAVVTNKPEDLSYRMTERLGLSAYFSFIVGGETLPRRKPDPAPLICALERFGAGENPLMVGDSTIDIEAARAAGIPVAAVAWGFGPRDEVIEARPDFIVEDPAELETLILGL